MEYEIKIIINSQNPEDFDKDDLISQIEYTFEESTGFQPTSIEIDEV